MSLPRFFPCGLTSMLLSHVCPGMGGYYTIYALTAHVIFN